MSSPVVTPVPVSETTAAQAPYRQSRTRRAHCSGLGNLFLAEPNCIYTAANALIEMVNFAAVALIILRLRKDAKSEATHLEPKLSSSRFVMLRQLLAEASHVCQGGILRKLPLRMTASS